MGQKVHPTVFRLGYNRLWQSRWFKRSFKEAVFEDFRIRQLIMARYNRAAIAEIIIERKDDATKLIIWTARPGVLIGRAGQGTKEIATLLGNIMPQQQRKVEIEVREVKNPELSARLVADAIVSAIERRIPYKRAIRQALARAQEKGVKGIKVQVAGRLGGAEIARRDRMSYGRVPLSSLKSDIDYSIVHAKTTWGTIGVKVWIYLGEKRDMEVD